MQPKTAKIVVTIFSLLVVIIRTWLAWPVNPLDTTNLLFLAFVMFIWFGQILFKSIALPGGLAVEFRDESITPEAKAKVNKLLKQIPPAQQLSVKWDKVDTVFWLGNDLMWIEDMTYRYARPERVLEGLENALRYIEDLGFAPNSFPVQELNTAKVVLQSLGGLSRENYKQVLQGHYTTVRQYVETVKFYIHSLANIQQPSFEKYTVQS